MCIADIVVPLMFESTALPPRQVVHVVRVKRDQGFLKLLPDERHLGPHIGCHRTISTAVFAFEVA